MDILALPNGLRYRFRYEWNLLSPTVRDAKTLHELNGADGIIALRQLNPQSPDLGSLPLRKVRIIKVTPFYGTFVVFDFVLFDRPFITPQLLSQFSDFVDKRVIAVKECFVYTSPDNFSFSEGPSEDERWHSLVMELEQIEKFKSSIFIKINMICDEQRETEALISNYEYQLRSGGSYRLEFIHRYPARLFEGLQKAVVSKICYSPEVISPIIEEQPVRGPYDLNKHYFYCPRNMRSLSSPLVLSGKSDSEEDIYFPSISLRIKKAWTRENVFLLVLGVGLSIAGGVDIVIRGIAKAGQLGTGVSFSNALELLALGWTESGILTPVLMFLGLILTFINRLPKN